MSALITHVCYFNDTEFTPGEEWGGPTLDAMVQWCTDHAIDATQIPMESTIVRDVKALTVTYDRLLLDVDGNAIREGQFGLKSERHVQQLDQPPAPWPALVRTVGTWVRRGWSR